MRHLLHHLPPRASSRTARVLFFAAAVAVGGALGYPLLAQDDGDTHVGDVLGDLVHIKRDPTTGQPILQKRDVLLPGDVPGVAYCPIPVDATGFEVPFLPLSCDPDPAYADAMIEVDYFGRLSGGRTQERNLRMHFDETIVGIKNSGTVTLDEAGRLKLGLDCTALGVCASWRTIDSPMENLAVYRRAMKYGHLQTDPLEIDTSPGGDPSEGTVYHPALDASDWAKFMGPVTALLPRASSGECFTGSAFNLECAAPTVLTTVDFFLAGALLSGAADKTGRITPDLVQYMNRILKITVATPEAAATLNTLPALIRDVDGTIAPATDGLPAPANERFVDFSAGSYLRSDWFDRSMVLLQPSGGVFVPTAVNFMGWLNLINGPKPTPAANLTAFVSSTSDALRVVQFIHEYEVPADLWAGPAGTTTTVAPRTVLASASDQNVGLTASVTSQSATPVTGSLTFSVRTAASVAVGQPVTVPVVNGTAAATYVLPGGTAPQVLTLVGLFTPTGSFASSVGFSTLTVSTVPGGGDVIQNGTFDTDASGWTLYGTPDASHIVWNVTNGVLQFYWVPTDNGAASQATIYQVTGLALAGSAPIMAQFDLGNSSTAWKRITVLLTEFDFSDRMMCTFWLPPNTPLRTYRMSTHTNRAWTNTAVYFYAATPGSDGGFYQIDNVSLYEDPAGPTDATYCVDPAAPAPPGGADGANLIANGDFATGLAPWDLFGQITAQVASGVLGFVRPPGTPAGVVFQATGQPIPAAGIVTARLDLGNSSTVRKRVTVMLHDQNFSDLAACMFWIEAGQALSSYEMRAFATRPWTIATLSVYPGTIDTEPWTLLDNVSLRQTPAVAVTGTECLEPTALTAAASAASASLGAVSAGGTMDASAPAWRTSGGFARSAAAAFGGTGLGWSVTASQMGAEALWWGDPVDLRGANGASLRFQSRLVSRASTAQVQVSEDGATWNALANVPPTDDWSLVAVDLSAFAGRTVLLRFVFETAAPVEPGVPPELWWIDDVEITLQRPSPAGGS